MNAATRILCKRSSRFSDEAIAHNRLLADCVAEIAKDIQASPAQVALAWLLSRSLSLSGSMAYQYPVEKSSFVMPLTIAEGRYFAELRDERLGRTLERKELDISANSGPWLFVDPC